MHPPRRLRPLSDEMSIDDPHGDFLDYTVRERIVRLEATVRQLEKTMVEVKLDVKEVRDVVVQVRGARWLLISLAVVASTIGAFARDLIPLIFRR